MNRNAEIGILIEFTGYFLAITNKTELQKAFVHIVCGRALYNLIIPRISATVIEFRNVNKWFGSLHVLRDIDLTIEAGKVVVVCGPSGSGKSTLIRCINRLETIQSGDIIVDGLSLSNSGLDLAKLRTRVGMVFQSFNLYPHMTVLANITLAPIKVKGLAKREAEEIAAELLARVGIPDKAQVYPANLSGGQQQRVAIARALAMKPKIMLFDEPTSALGPRDDQRSPGSHDRSRARRYDHGRCHP